MREVHASKRGVFALNSKRIFSIFGEEVPWNGEGVGVERGSPGSPVAGVIVVIGFLFFAKPSVENVPDST